MYDTLVSIIVPAYNYASYLPDTIKSLQSQTYHNWECLVIDDGSTDNTREVVEALKSKDTRIKYIYQKNQGLSSTRNTGIKHATGSFIQFLDADDLIESQKIEKQVDFLIQNPEISIVYGETRFFRNEFPNERRYSLFEPDIKWIPEVSFTEDELIIKLVKENFIPVNAPLLRSEIINVVNGFDTNLGMFADWDFWLRCAAERFKMKFVPADNTLALVRMHSTSMTHYESPKHSAERSLIREKISTYKINQTALITNDYFRSATLMSEALTAIKSGKIIKGAEKLSRSLRMDNRATYDVFRQTLKRKFNL